ncbi:LOW QUALITY PROTEIN: phospholipid-transporting ATPase IH [Ictidomys tridecemlineatus]
MVLMHGLKSGSGHWSQRAASETGLGVGGPLWKRVCAGEENWVDSRTIYVGHKEPPPGAEAYIPQRYPDNRIVSSKYTFWNFIPKNLFEQFRRIANFYFLIIFLVQLIIDTPTSPVTSGLPLFFVITVTAIKQGYEDWLRHKADNAMNQCPVHFIQHGKLVRKQSRKLRVGDIVMVKEDETFPCDLIFLSSNRGDGTCHVTTASLDGESSHKVTSLRQDALGAWCPDSAMATDADCHGSWCPWGMGPPGPLPSGGTGAGPPCLCPELSQGTSHSYAGLGGPAGGLSSGLQESILGGLAFSVVTVHGAVASLDSAGLGGCVPHPQVEYIFTDKTGTLTENNMAFKECCIEGQVYVPHVICNGQVLPDSSGIDMIDSSPGVSGREREELFFRALCLCHTVQVKDDDQVDGPRKSPDSGKSCVYISSSPDEVALVEGIQRLGFTYLRLKDNYMEILNRNDDIERFELLEILSFDSVRRRMSVIVRAATGEIYLFCKGADSSIFPRVTEGRVDQIRARVERNAVEGLRTLCVAYKSMAPEEYEAACRLLQAAKVALQDREKKLAEAYEQIERDLILLGATAVEDRLQEKAADTIEALQKAGIKVWVLTGDKMETAAATCYACKLFRRNTQLLELTTKRIEEQSLHDVLFELSKTVLRCSGSLTRDNFSGLSADMQDYGLIIDGAALSLIMKPREDGSSSNYRELFLEICRNCSAVLCCRMAPLQKAQIVKLIKFSKEHPITLAIGDGANDVSMILEAHVGIGVIGKEGRQAARNSDYAIPKFKHLKKMLLVHGHFYYIRISELVQYFFYKNVCFIFPQFLYQFFCGFSQQTLYDTAYLTLYNISFTSLPILLYSLMEQHVGIDVLKRDPSLYRDIAKNALLRWRVFTYWTFLGLFDALVFFFGAYFMFENTVVTSGGQMFGNWTFGTLVFTVMVFTVTLKLALDTHYWTWINHFVIWGSLLFYIVFSLLWGGIIWPFLSYQRMYYVFLHMLSSGPAWLGIILLITVSLLPDVLKKVLCRQLWPTATERTQSSQPQESVSGLVPLASLQSSGAQSPRPLAALGDFCLGRQAGCAGGQGAVPPMGPLRELLWIQPEAWVLGPAQSPCHGGQCPGPVLQAVLASACALVRLSWCPRRRSPGCRPLSRTSTPQSFIPCPWLQLQLDCEHRPRLGPSSALQLQAGFTQACQPRHHLCVLSPEEPSSSLYLHVQPPSTAVQLTHTTLSAPGPSALPPWCCRLDAPPDPEGVSTSRPCSLARPVADYLKKQLLLTTSESPEEGAWQGFRVPFPVTSCPWRRTLSWREPAWCAPLAATHPRRSCQFAFLEGGSGVLGKGGGPGQGRERSGWLSDTHPAVAPRCGPPKPVLASQSQWHAA